MCCRGSSPASEVRLVGGSNRFEGRLEVYYAQQWGTVCDDEFDDIDAGVFCRMLGYGCGVYLMSPKEGGPIWLDDIGCNGQEDHVSECPKSSWGITNCGHTEDVSIRCDQHGGSYRLVDGPHSAEGKVEVFHESTWKAACMTHVIIERICQQLGYLSGKILLDPTEKYGQGSRVIWMNGVSCYGNESTVQDCSYGEIGFSDCDHNENVYLQCSHQVSLIPDDIRLLNGRSPNEGVLQVLHDGTWGTVCDDGFDSSVASLFCQLFGFSSGEALLEPDERFGSGNDVIWMDDVICSPEARDLNECEFNGWGEVDCDHSEDVSVRCLGERVTLRLVDGALRGFGRLEVFYDGQWGTVCDDGFTNNEAKVFCSALGYRDGSPSRIQYGKSTGPIWMDDVVCKEAGTSLADCEHAPFGTNNCEHIEDISLQCVGYIGYPVRLLDGVFKNEGRVEIFLNLEWGTMCGEGFTDLEANVVCRMLGYGRGISLGNQYGPGWDNIWVDSLRCHGQEETIIACFGLVFGPGTCDHDSDVSVRCLE
ncbi:hypothetical protein CAPTEDRAFT_171695 [Capitella teleta]|uniref:SRCR domain-containing protein n=1 Tax=Capitella teleta TaxID=283909 RepID=R7TZW8_CAPTE|nr:hypothetical protein CAPTEDRAFT_171695 [Capitella teleta]|eukprot:ELT96946.1 hypothetical protein CAPTEDRAFT_171695 [Capitella teleta]